VSESESESEVSEGAREVGATSRPPGGVTEGARGEGQELTEEVAGNGGKGRGKGDGGKAQSSN
jgi:hypothetical protein